MITHVQKWGNSIALRIPKPIADDLGLGPNSAVEIRQEHGTLTLIPIKKNEVTLEELLAQITPENLHGEINTGSPVGNEIW